MTIQEAIRQCDEMQPNAYSMEEKVRWLTRLDGRIWREILSTHEGADGEAPAYTVEDMDALLLVPSPYEEMYLLYLQSQIDYNNAEYGRYNNSTALFNEAYQAYANDINRTRRPVGCTTIRV